MQHIVCLLLSLLGHDCYSLGAGRLTLLIPLPERKYGRWPNTEAYDWWSQWEGSVSKPLCKPRRRHTHISTSAGMPRFLDSKDSLQGDFPFQQLFSSSSNHNQLKDRDLICCHSSPAWLGWQAGSGAAPEIFRGFRNIPCRAKRQWLEIRPGRRKGEASSGERGIHLMASQ